MNTSTESRTGKDFLEYSRDIARDFLQSVMVVDDQAHFTGDEKTFTEAKTLTSPRSRNFSAQSKTTKTVTSLKFEKDTADFVDDPDHQLNAKKVIDKFADNGIACAILRPSDGETELIEKVKALALKSDILVFDWVLKRGDAEGKTVIDIISNIVSNDLSKERRLRLIVVYTGQKKLKKIIKTLKAKITEIKNDHSLSIKIESPNDYTVKAHSIRICAFAKEGIKDKILESDQRIVTNENLAERLISEFTEMTAGLVSNAALKAFSVLRSETHRILSRFNIKLDPAFLAHRVMLKQPNEAGRLLSMLIGSDLTSLLEEKEIGENTDTDENFDLLQAWLKFKEEEGVKIREGFENNNRIPSEKEILSLIRKGLSEASVAGQYGISHKKLHKANLTGRFSGVKTETPSAKAAESEFAVLTTFKPDFKSQPPQLVLGTVLKNEREKTYWVCIQALCDCVRITGKRKFPLLPLLDVNDTDNFNFVIQESEELKKVKVDFRPYSLRSENFMADPNHQTIYGIKEFKSGNIKYKFITTQRKKYVWVGELRFAHAQRIANQFAGQISRVGLDESEWQRLWLPDVNN